MMVTVSSIAAGVSSRRPRYGLRVLWRALSPDQCFRVGEGNAVELRISLGQRPPQLDRLLPRGQRLAVPTRMIKDDAEVVDGVGEVGLVARVSRGQRPPQPGRLLRC